MNRLPETIGNVVTSWIPLESAWPGNTNCASLLWNYYDTIIAAYDPGYGVTAAQDVTCHPKAVTTWWLQERLGPNTETVVSLGPITCPEDYTTAAQRVQDSSSTLIACCPSGYDYNGQVMSQGDTGQCASKVAKGDTMQYLTLSQESWITTVATAEHETSVIGVQINGWKFAEETTAPTPDTGSVTLAASSQTASADAAPQSSASDTSAKIGIGIGVSLGATGLVALGAGLLMMYRARKMLRSMPPPHVEKDLSDGGNRSVSSSQLSQSYTPKSPETNPRVEMPQYPEQSWSSGHFAEPTVYPAYGVTVPHGEMEGTVPVPPPDVTERIQRRMELEGEFERNLKVLTYPHR